jgi:hypothetical protein
LCPPTAQEEEEEPKSVTVRSTVFGKVYETGFVEGSFAFPPHWDQNEPNPPVSARRAMRIAKKRRDELVFEKPKGFSWKLDELSLKTDGYGWAWFVTYKAVTEDAPETDENRITLIVVMNGTALPFEGYESEAPEPPREVRPVRDIAQPEVDE